MKGKTLPLLIVPAACSAFVAFSEFSSGAVLANYAFAGGTSASTDTDSNSTASPLTFSNGANTGTTTGTGAVTGAAISSSTDMFYFRTTGLTSSESGAIGAPDYISFTFTPNPGTAYNLQTITLNFGGSNAGGTAAAYTSYAFLRSSLEDTPYSTNIGTTISRNVPGPGDGAVYNLALETFTFTDPAFANVTVPVTFRLYLYSSANDVSNQIVRLDDVRLNGTLIPEPTSALLAAIGLGSAALRRRR